MKVETKKEVSLDIDDSKLFDDLEKVFESQNKEIAKLTSQLLLSKDYETALCDEVDRFQEDAKNKQNNLEDLKSTVEAKDLEILEFKKEAEVFPEMKSKLCLEISDLRKLLEVTRKSNKAKLKEKDSKLKNALELVIKVKDNIATSKVKETETYSKQETICNKNLKGESKFENYQNILNFAKDSLKEITDMNDYTSEKVIEAVSNNKKASKYMVREVKKQFEEFEAEVEGFADCFSLDSTDADEDYSAADCDNSRRNNNLRDVEMKPRDTSKEETDKANLVDQQDVFGLEKIPGVEDYDSDRSEEGQLDKIDSIGDNASDLANQKIDKKKKLIGVVDYSVDHLILT